MSRRRRKNPFGPTDALGVGTLALIGLGAYLFYNWWKSKGPGAPSCSNSSLATTIKEALTGQPAGCAVVAKGTIQMPDGSVVNASCYPMTMISGTDVAEVQTANGPVYVQSGNTNNGAYVATANPPDCQCYSAALQKWSCCQ